MKRERMIPEHFLIAEFPLCPMGQARTDSATQHREDQPQHNGMEAMT